MTSRLRWFWTRLDANYWFYPALFVIGGVVLAVVLLSLDHQGFGKFIQDAGPPFAATPGSAQTMLQIIAGAMLGAAATVFSITIAAVAYASGTYGPRLLSNFLEDKGNQFSLATLLGTFVFSITVLNSVRLGSDGPDAYSFVPQLSLMGAYLLTALSVAVIVYLLNHIPSSIRINHVLEEIGRRLLKDIRAHYPETYDGSSMDDAPEGERFLASNTGYVQLIDFDGLARLAQGLDCQFALEVRTGDFVHHGKPLMRLCGGQIEGELAEKIETHFTFGAVRTPEQDPQFLIDELVEIGLRALSPGINDPFTAITSLHWLGAAISELGLRDLRKRDGMREGTRYVFPLPDDFSHFIARSFGAIRSAVAASPIASRIMLETMASAAKANPNAARREMLAREADDLLAQSRLVLAGPDLALVEARYAEVK